MKRIEREYAIIYIDEEGESLSHDHYTPEFIINDYYDKPGFLQWNFYLIIPIELVTKDEIKIIQQDEYYTRKIVVAAKEIENFINDLFPVLDEQNRGTIKLIKGESWKEATKLAYKESKKKSSEFGFRLIPSYYRDENLTFSLMEMDKLRAELIKNNSLRAIFYTNISNEYYLAKKKFELFLDLS